ncbi:hypothetical protein M758_7G100200 [Ceratodon purpureus]|nr:hypothetical protein M758_7G100200 [Ceratodon purpureus]
MLDYTNNLQQLSRSLTNDPRSAISRATSSAISNAISCALNACTQSSILSTEIHSLNSKRENNPLHTRLQNTRPLPELHPSPRHDTNSSSHITTPSSKLSPTISPLSHSTLILPRLLD